MLTQQTPQQEVQQIDCTQIHRFVTLIDAQAYQQMEGGMVIREQGQNVWYVMPQVDGILVGGCMEESQ